MWLRRSVSVDGWVSGEGVACDGSEGGELGSGARHCRRLRFMKNARMGCKQG